MQFEQYVDLLGVPFERGGRGPDRYDCYGLVIELYRRQGVNLPDFESPGTLEKIEQLLDDESKKWRKVPAMTPNSVIHFRVDTYGAHVGVMLDGDRFIHTTDGTGVTTDRIGSGGYNPIGFYIYE